LNFGQIESFADFLPQPPERVGAPDLFRAAAFAGAFVI
jgi:hypothetical protein